MKVLSRKNCNSQSLPKIVSLFCGAGGLDLGFHQEGFEISLAIDISPAAISTHAANFSNSKGIAADLIKLGPRGVLKQVEKVIPFNSRIGIIGGPPCQGFSRANAKSHSADPRNKLPLLYLKIIACLQKYYMVEFVVFENVMGIRDKKHAEMYDAITTSFGELGFSVNEERLLALDFGVPQTRRRVVLIATSATCSHPTVTISERKRDSTVSDAIRDLPSPVFYASRLAKNDIPYHPNHWTMKPKSKKFKNPDDMKMCSRSFRRLSWTLPSPTIAFGNREIHVHPDGHRRLSIFEAMLLQGFPKEFVLEGNLSEQVVQISNAVPPPVAKGVAAAVKSAFLKSVGANT